MTTLVRFTLAAAALTLSGALLPAGGRAAGTGVAYDSVTKFQQMGGAAPQPGSFQSDYQVAASATSAPAPHLPFGFGHLAQASANITNMMKNGSAEKHYIGTTKQRTDDVLQGTADIVDCAARTVTHLDLNAKTYTVTSLDQPQSAPGSRGGAPGPAATDDGSTMKIVMTTKALGQVKLDGLATNGYDMNMKVTTTKPSGESSTYDADFTSYYSGLAEPRAHCGDLAARSFHSGSATSGGGLQGGLPGGALFDTIRRALAAEKGNPRFSVTNSGPSIPSGKLSLWELMTLADPKGGGSLAIETERGDVRSIGDDDAVFSVPPDFKKV